MDEMTVGKIEFLHDEHQHCWHDTGQMLTSDPPQSVEICCFCGGKRHYLISKIVPKYWHGPFAPEKGLA